MADCRIRTGKFKINLEYLVLEKQRRFHKMMETLQKDPEGRLKGLPLAQIWDNLIIKIQDVKVID